MRAVRIEFGISRRAMADHLAISIDQLKRFERGAVALRLGPAYDFCALTNTSPLWLAFGDSYPRAGVVPYHTSPAIQEQSLLFVERMRSAREGSNIALQATSKADEKSRALRSVAQNEFKRYLTRMPATIIVPSWDELRSWLAEETSTPGAKGTLAAYCEVTSAAVSQWLSGVTKPTAETTLKLLKWVTRPERDQQTKGPARASTRAGLTTRKSKSRSNEKAKSDQKTS